MITNFNTFLTPLARYMAILRRNQSVVNLVGVLVSAAWCAKSNFYMWSGEIESDLSRITTAKIGSLKDPSYSVSSLLKRLRKYRSSLSYSIFCLRDSNLKYRLDAAIDDLETDVSDGALRKQPFCVMLYGYPGTGKSSFAIQIAKRLMTDLYGEFKTSDMVTLNETDQYQSEFRTSHKVVLFDDIGASKYGLNDTTNPWRKVIDFVNNIKKTALNPNVEMKGKVYIEPDLVILTSNLDFRSTGHIGGYIPAYEAILRRLSRIVRVQSHSIVHPLEPGKWITESPSGSPYLTHHQDYFYRGGKTPVDVLREDYIEELSVAFQEHNQDQEQFLAKFNSYFDDYPKQLDLSDEILVSQSSIPNLLQFDDYDEACILYYVKHVNWERFFVEWKHLDEKRVNSYVLTQEGIVLYYGDIRTDHFISVSHFNKAYARVKETSSEKVQIKAESKSTLGKPKFNYPDSSELLQRERLIQHCQAMSYKWNTPGCRNKKILHYPYNKFLTTTKKGKPTKDTYYMAYAVYICFDLNLDPSQLFQEHPFIDRLPKSYLKSISYYISQIEENLQIVRSMSQVKVNSVNESSDSSEFNNSLSDISEVIVNDVDGVEPESCLVDIFTKDEDDDEFTIFTEAIEPIKSNSSRSQESEAEQIGRVARLIPYEGVKPVIHRNVSLCIYGEIDLIVDDGSTILVIECKRSINNIVKGCDQARRYSNVLAVLRPNQRILGLLYTPLGFRVVTDHNQEASNSYARFLCALGYNP